ncbi:Major facilitator superfamily domain general substrate transporter [Penicillium concentricum]|uniref:Major facilitator superfamily domain general substrate transporter n=1 Tax=Penicillium concentricum TaxID=293559 RepID=A0A9W9SXV9_9EURO|nr:Major facilitator superfamily domain general substrate transporter [Penicillium concentricum]KAJ5384838.1 Major facilitator superfamily domain general substrate transporter [Penicillium concentricum]
MGKFHARLYKTDRARDFDHEQDRYVRMRQIYETVDRQGFQWIVVLVAGLGFFLDGYTLFASNMALPMISYVYWRDDTSSLRLTCINIATLGGTLLGQVAFGFLADKNGRKKMYGVELVLLITATLGVVMSSTGVDGSMNVYAWLIWWRICVGIGVGADYPLSAVITSEFAPTKHRARMMATVFFMQPLGQIAGNIVALIVIAVARGNSSPGEDITRTVDIMWRWVIAIGVVPGAVATLFRFAIPESPRYLVDIVDDPITAEFDATTLFSDTPGMLDSVSWGNTATCSAGGAIQLPPISSIASSSITDNDDDDEYTHLPPPTLNSHWRLARTDIVRYFWTEGNWRSLAGCSLAWLLLDFGFYGIGLSSPQFLAKTWGALHISEAAPTWMTDDTPNANIFQMFMDTSVRGLIVLNIGSFVGGILLIIFAHKLDRVALQKYMFLALAALFIALGTMFVSLYSGPPAVVALYIVGQIMFNFGESNPGQNASSHSNQLPTGPNATTYMIPAEIFPTRYRATCHGISAGAGKLGSILVQIFSAYYHFGSGPGNESTRKHGIVLLVFSACMVLGAVVTHFWIPPIQQRRNGKTKLWGGKPETLESLSLGRMGRKSRDADCRKRTSRHRALSMSA